MSAEWPPKKAIAAANPWHIAAAAQRLGIDDVDYIETDLVPDGKALVIDLEALFALPLKINLGASSAGVPEQT